MDETLKYAIEHGILDLAHVEEQIRMNRRKELLEKHPHAIWKGENDQKWYTYLPDEEKGRKLVKRTTKKSIEDEVVEYWKEQQENPTITEVFNECNDRRLELKKISPATHLRNQQIFNKHYKEFGKKRIKNVEPFEIEEFLEEQIPEYGLTAKAFSNLKSVTKCFLKRAKKRKLISYNVEEMLSDLDTSESDFKKVIKEDYEEVFNEEETEKILSYLIKNRDLINLGIIFIFVTGLRIGELVALKHEDFCEDYGVNIRRTETRYRGDDKQYVYEIKDFPKTAAGARTVILPQNYTWLIDALNSNNPSGTFVFVKNGERIKAQSIRRRLYGICDKLDIYRKSPHKIRKTYGTILLDNNIDKRLILDQMGHADILCTESRYHRNRKTCEKKSEIISNIPDFRGA